MQVESSIPVIPTQESGEESALLELRASVSPWTTPMPQERGSSHRLYSSR